MKWLEKNLQVIWVVVYSCTRPCRVWGVTLSPQSRLSPSLSLDELDEGNTMAKDSDVCKLFECGYWSLWRVLWEFWSLGLRRAYPTVSVLFFVLTCLSFLFCIWRWFSWLNGCLAAFHDWFFERSVYMSETCGC